MHIFEHHYQRYLLGKIDNWSTCLENEYNSADYFIENGQLDQSLGFCNKSWDTDVLGIKVGSIVLPSRLSIKAFPHLLSNAIHFANKNKYKLITIRLSYDAFDYTRVLGQSGFSLVDAMNVFLFEKKQSKCSFCTNQNDAVTFTYLSGGSTLKEPEIEKIGVIASDAFMHGRVTNDSNFNLEQKRNFYQACAHSLISNDNNQMILLHHNDNLVGFCVYGHSDQGEFNPLLGYLWMIGIDKDYRGQGLGETLLSHCISRAARQYQYFEVATQINNYSALQLYARFELRFCASIMSFHCWL